MWTKTHIVYFSPSLEHRHIALAPHGAVMMPQQLLLRLLLRPCLMQHSEAATTACAARYQVLGYVTHIQGHYAAVWGPEKCIPLF